MYTHTLVYSYTRQFQAIAPGAAGGVLHRPDDLYGQGQRGYSGGVHSTTATTTAG